VKASDPVPCGNYIYHILLHKRYYILWTECFLTHHRLRPLAGPDAGSAQHSKCLLSYRDHSLISAKWKLGFQMSLEVTFRCLCTLSWRSARLQDSISACTEAHLDSQTGVTKKCTFCKPFMFL